VVTISLFVRRSVDTKRRLCQPITRALSAVDVPAIDVDIVIHEAALENWARSGILASERELGFDVDI
jgi:phenylpyruvate tautomerase PptA (4-oxalocrotonate tautomerase family)